MKLMIMPTLFAASVGEATEHRLELQGAGIAGNQFPSNDNFFGDIVSRVGDRLTVTVPDMLPDFSAAAFDVGDNAVNKSALRRA